ncbi:RHS repeat-associated core domain-containing protein [Pseudomonas sp. C2B4]|uniref:RHS repeat-associated core domain-containing protein n=1 Tax=Pseudomonas sp. C2B4 TaxID=2735270 RepID=UPI00158620DC|nr:RHS repeat-associated core domain-containing protein [Pseudomonas sp. C2B4]NUU34529.1 RHS repeat-associated core domain-containing protein [Pseudomonas sp. C2B4]
MTQPWKQNPTGQHTVLLATDLKKSVHAEIEAGKINRMAYLPYGQQSAQLEVMTRVGFNGELREAGLDWYLLGNGYRAYNPWLMRFHSPDSLSPFGKGGRNTYMYCCGEPVMNSDPSGHVFGFFSWGLGKLAGGLRTVVSKTTTFATSAVSNTASTISRSASQVAEVLGSSKKALSNALLGAEPFPGPPPPRFVQTPPKHYVVTQRNPYQGPNSVRYQRTPFVSKTGNGPRITGTTGPTKRVTELRKGS